MAATQYRAFTARFVPTTGISRSSSLQDSPRDRGCAEEGAGGVRQFSHRNLSGSDRADFAAVERRVAGVAGEGGGAGARDERRLCCDFSGCEFASAAEG